MEQHQTPILRVINGGGIPQRNEVLNQVYANVLNKPVLVPEDDVTSLGSAIFAFLAAGAFATVQDAQKALCPAYKTYLPQPESREVYDELFGYFRILYFGLGQSDSAPVSIGGVLPALRRIASRARRATT
jgi:L-ribulokinase